jgi:beta-lactam-binding protein with PASTA domain
MSETMKRGFLENLLFAALLVLAFGLSTYVCFNFFIRGRSVSTPNLIGRSISDAKRICTELGVSLVVDPEHRRNSDKIAVGNVVWQNRAPGATNLIKRGTDIHVELSAGPLVLQVPDLDGQSSRTALLRLGQQNLKLGNLAYIDSNAQGILAEEPPKGTVVAAQKEVSLLVGVPPAPLSYVMPDLIDRALDTVRPALESRGLSVSNVKFESYPGIADGIISRQFPLRGAPVSGRDPITVVVSRQEEGGIIEQPAAAPPTTTQ